MTYTTQQLQLIEKMCHNMLEELSCDTTTPTEQLLAHIDEVEQLLDVVIDAQQ